MPISNFGHDQGQPGHRQFISEAARGHSATAASGLGGSGGGGGNANLAAPVPYLISERGGEVSHLWVAGGQVYDPYTRGINQASGWAIGVAGFDVGRAAASAVGGDGRRLVEGLAGFSSANYLRLGSGLDVLDFDGDFSVAVVFSTPTPGDVVFQNLIADTDESTRGWQVRLTSTTGYCNFVLRGAGAAGAAVSITSANTPPAGALSVVCAGVSGAAAVVKTNLAPTVISSSIVARPTGALDLAKLGAGPTAPFTTGTIYELWASMLPASDELFASIAQEVKGKMGIPDANLFVRSEEFSSASWVKTSTTVAENAAPAPDGTATADKIAETVAASTIHGVYQRVDNCRLGVGYIVSHYVKAAERTICFLINASVAFANTPLVVFNLAAGTSTFLSGPQGVTHGIQALPGGWYRIWMRAAAQADAAGDFYLELGDASGNRLYTGDGTSGIYAWGAQLDRYVTAPGSYTPTLAAPFNW